MRESFTVDTQGKGFVDITSRVNDVVARALAGGPRDALCTVFVHHTSASLVINENADPTVRRDLEAFMARLVVDGDPLFQHTDEGPDDMSAHVRSVLTATTLGIPVANARLDLGTWQAVYLWEHRARPHTRKITVVVTPA